MKGGKSSSIPPLQSKTGCWMLSPSQKAGLLAETYANKFRLPIEKPNQYSDRIFASQICMSGFLPFRRRHAQQILSSLREDSATGPDLLPTRVLTRCARSLALPVCMIVRMIVASGCWPRIWQVHWLFPLYKKHARHDASNYRGIHLTPQLSKVVERMIGVHLLPFLEKSGVYGPSQFAYRIGHGYRDALAYVTFNWVWALGLGKRVAVYCSDVSGAFDRVSAPKLLAKLSSAGVHPDLLKVLAAWLQERSANVCVDGCMSDSFALRNSVFQGTVLGPPLWNVFYGDARHAIHEVGFEECIFADDLNCFKVLAGSYGDNSAFNLLGRCQETLHKWGEANQVTFEPSKETMHVLDRYDPCGGSFKLLSVVFDGRLGMHEAVHHLCSEASWRLKTLLRTRRFYDCNSMLRLFKAQILSFLEGATPAIYHASPATLLQLDNIQTTFLEELGVTSEQALLEHNLAPLSMRRDFAMLAILYKVSRMTAPAPIQKLFSLEASTLDAYGFTGGKVLHRWRIMDPICPSHPVLIKRSIFGLVCVFNSLPAQTAEAETVKSFQSRLQHSAKAAARQAVQSWPTMFHRAV